jgi:hypothetical protein
MLGSEINRKGSTMFECSNVRPPSVTVRGDATAVTELVVNGKVDRMRTKIVEIVKRLRMVTPS